jgi:hypothetical protein
MRTFLIASAVGTSLLVGCTTAPQPAPLAQNMPPAYYQDALSCKAIAKSISGDAPQAMPTFGSITMTIHNASADSNYQQDLQNNFGLCMKSKGWNQ